MASDQELEICEEIDECIEDSNITGINCFLADEGEELCEKINSDIKKRSELVHQGF